MMEVGKIAWQDAALPASEVEECDLYYENRDIEDVFKRWDSLVSDAELVTLERVLREAIARLENPQSAEDIEEAEEDEGDERKKKRRRRKKPKAKTASYNSVVVPLLHEHSILVRKAAVLQAYQMFVSEGTLTRCERLESLLVTKSSKSGSGVLVITVLTSPYPTVDGVKQRFSCEWNCYYCPNQPGQPRSYLRDEPAVLRANQNGFDPVLQFCDRARVLAQNGHPLDKVELLVLGGTWSSYPAAYQEAFVRDLFYAANTVHSRGANRRPRKSLLEEQKDNESAICKIIGLTLETRPDCVDFEELRRLRAFGCTRVQLGIQHTDNRILDKINRGCTTEDAKRALILLKDSCFKVDIHLMPNLPGSDVQTDERMFQQVLEDEDLHADQWKIYPCEVTPWTVIKKWYDQGLFVPYPEHDLLELLMRVKAKVHPWIRLNRVVRDIPTQYILGGVNNPSLRQYLQEEMQRRGTRCNCIRCREVGLQKTPDQVQLFVRKYQAQGGLEFFISFETPDERTLLGFARLRINWNTNASLFSESPSQRHSRLFSSSSSSSSSSSTKSSPDNSDNQRGRLLSQEPTETTRRRKRSKSPAVRFKYGGDLGAKHCQEAAAVTPFPELEHAGLVRELHVYGQLIPTSDRKDHAAQHVGIGTRLMQNAERIALEHGAKRVAVIAGVGVRDFYRKLGYELHGEGQMMMKDLTVPRSPMKHFLLGIATLVVLLSLALSQRIVTFN